MLRLASVTICFFSPWLALNHEGLVGTHITLLCCCLQSSFAMCSALYICAYMCVHKLHCLTESESAVQRDCMFVHYCQHLWPAELQCTDIHVARFAWFNLEPCCFARLAGVHPLMCFVQVLRQEVALWSHLRGRKVKMEKTEKKNEDM